MCNVKCTSCTFKSSHSMIPPILQAVNGLNGPTAEAVSAIIQMTVEQLH